MKIALYGVFQHDSSLKLWLISALSREKSRQRTTLQPTDVKTEESERAEEEENGIKKEKSSENIVPTEDEMSDNSETPSSK